MTDIMGNEGSKTVCNRLTEQNKYVETNSLRFQVLYNIYYLTFYFVYNKALEYLNCVSDHCVVQGHICFPRATKALKSVRIFGNSFESNKATKVFFVRHFKNSNLACSLFFSFIGQFISRVTKEQLPVLKGREDFSAKMAFQNGGQSSRMTNIFTYGSTFPCNLPSLNALNR